MVDVLLRICFILGVKFNRVYLNSLEDDCKKIEYLLNQIYFFLGGK